MIKYIVIHHSVTPRDLSLDKSIRSFSSNHKDRLDQPDTSLDLPEDMKNCAYHWVIAGDGSKKQTRGIPDNFEIGYHASSLEINRESLGICLTGNFDEEELSKEQIQTFVKLLHWIRKQEWGKDVEIIGHRDVKDVYKTCPGDNLYKLLPKIIEMSDTKVPEWAEPTVEKMEEKGIATDPTEVVGEMKLYHLMAVIEKFIKE